MPSIADRQIKIYRIHLNDALKSISFATIKKIAFTNKRKTHGEFLIYKSTCCYKKRGKELYNININHYTTTLLLKTTKKIEARNAILKLAKFNWADFSFVNQKLRSISISVESQICVWYRL